MNPNDRILVALDTPDAGRARELARLLVTEVGGFKIGLELFSSHGPEIVAEIGRAGGSTFLDLKLHDIPNTVAGAAAAIGRLGVTYFTVHASGGAAMIRRAVEAASEAAEKEGLACPIALAVTVLTSLDDAALATIGFRDAASHSVARLAALAAEAGAGGIVCSPLEVARVRELYPGGTLVVPGIRPVTADGLSGDDQARTSTPAGAVAAGADRLVIGRPITRAADPAEAARSIAAEIAGS